MGDGREPTTRPRVVAVGLLHRVSSWHQDPHGLGRLALLTSPALLRMAGWGEMDHVNSKIAGLSEVEAAR